MLGLFGSSSPPRGNTGARITPTSGVILENSAQGTSILTFQYKNTVAPSAVTLQNISPAGALQMNANGTTLEVGPTAINFESNTLITAEARFTDQTIIYSTTIAVAVQDTLITVTTLPSLNPALLRVGDTISAAFVSGAYSVFGGAVVTEGTKTYYVNGNVVASNYVLAVGDLTAYVTVNLTAPNEAPLLVTSLAKAVTDFTFTANTLNYVVPAGTSQPPSQFSGSDWSLVDPISDGDLTIQISTLPANNGSAITSIERELDNSGTWVALSAATTGNYTLSGLTNGQSYSVKLRALSANGTGPASASKSATPTAPATVPNAFVSGNWSVSDRALGGTVRITITALPSNGGSAITSLQYRIDGGSAVTLGGTTTGNYDVTGLTDDVSVNFELRAVNSVGNSSWGDVKSVTPTPLPASPFIEQEFTGLDSTSNVAVYQSTQITIGATANRVLIAEIAYGTTSNGAVTSGSIATFGAQDRADGEGTPMTVFHTGASGANRRTRTCYAVLINPPSGAGTVKFEVKDGANTPASATCCVIRLKELSNSNQTIGNYIHNGTNGSSVTARTVSITTTVNNTLGLATLAILSGDFSSEIAASDGGTLIHAENTGNTGTSDITFAFLKELIATAGTDTIGATWTTAADATLSYLGVPPA